MRSKQLKKICAKSFKTCIAAHPEKEGICLRKDIADPCDGVLRDFLEVKRYGTDLQ